MKVPKMYIIRNLKGKKENEVEEWLKVFQTGQKSLPRVQKPKEVSHR